MVKTNYYFHVTIQPHNCDGLGKTNYLSDCLIEELDKVTQELSQRYAWSVEDNTSNDGKHIHIALHLNSPCDQKSLYSYFNDIVLKYYALTEDGMKHCVDIQHKTLNKLYLLVSGYFMKQKLHENFDITPNNTYKCYGFDDDKLEVARKEYLVLKEQSLAKDRAKKSFLDPDRKDLHICKDISSFLKCLKTLYDTGEYQDLFSLENYGELHIILLRKYKLSYHINNKNQFLRQLTEFFISHNIDTEKEKVSLVNYFRPKQEEYISTSIDRYFLFE